MIVNLSTPQNNYFERTETLKRYYDDIRKYTPLTIEKEQKLIKIYHISQSQQEKKQIRDEIMCSNQRFVLGVVRRWATNDNILDLISEANIGMAEALEEYDVKQNVRFITFAVYYIRRAINTYILKHGCMVKRNNLAKTNHLINQIINNFMQKELRQPTNDEIVEILERDYNVSIKDSKDILNVQMSSIDEDYGCDDEDVNVSTILAFNNASANGNDFEEKNNKEFAQKMVQSVLKKLTPTEQEVVKYLFGVGHVREYELKEIAEKMNFTSERIRQLKISALEKMKKAYVNMTKNL
jgi:RNA polymerase primary sigma factor